MSSILHFVVIVLRDSPCEEIAKRETCPIFERGQIAGACLAGGSVSETATLLGVSRMTVSKVMSAQMNHVKTISVKRNSGYISTLTE
jgi:hypothetical protein